MDWSDKRPVTELRFGVEWKPTIGELQAQQPGFGAVDAPFGLREGDPPSGEALTAWNVAHTIDRARLFALLGCCSCITANDIVNLGCTGAHAAGLTIDDIQFLRIGLGGSGVGLPCFVPPDRYCLAHDVTGGLQDGQEQRHAEEVGKLSRPLAPHEAAQRELLDHARSAQGENREAATADVLAGRKLPEGWERDGGEVQRGIEDAKAGRVLAIPPSALAEWECPEHTETVWACRYCVAQTIVEGALVPEFVIHRPESESALGEAVFGVHGATVSAHIDQHDAAGVAEVDVYVLATRYTRKLSR